jgi:hypothetical protein
MMPKIVEHSRYLLLSKTTSGKPWLRSIHLLYLTLGTSKLVYLRSNSMRIALLSDIHGNPLALDAVLADIEAPGGVDMYWVLGDFSSRARS